MNRMQFVAALFLFSMMAVTSSCNRAARKAEAPAPQPSTIRVAVNGSGPVVITSSSAEFEVLPSGYIQASLIKGDQKLTLDEVEQDKPVDNNFVVSDGKAVPFILDVGSATIKEATGKMGRGKAVDIPARASSGNKLQAVLTVEVYDDFPNIALTSVAYKNADTSDIKIDQAVVQRHRFSSHVANAPYDMWSYQGSSYDWGKDDVVKMKP